MEFRLNKIDTDLRESINNETREGKVHTKKGININKDATQEKRHNKQYKDKPKEKFDLDKYRNKDSKITIEVFKVENIEITAEKKENSSNGDQHRGRFIDIKR